MHKQSHQSSVQTFELNEVKNDLFSRVNRKKSHIESRNSPFPLKSASQSRFENHNRSVNEDK